VNINGVYRFYQDGELVATHKNILTNEGVRLILRYMAGQASSLGGAIAVGVSDSPAAASDVRLGFEVYRSTISLRNPDFKNGRVVFKGVIEQDVSFHAKEAGLWSTESTEFDSVSITAFPADEVWTNSIPGGTWFVHQEEAAPRIELPAGTPVSTRTEVSMDLSGSSVDDTFVLAFGNEEVETITMVFENTVTGGKYTLTKNVAGVTIYGFAEFRKGDFVPTGTISWDTIDSFGFDFTGPADSAIELDGLRLEDNDRLDQSHVLVSRTVFSTPLTKSSTAPMDVEYALEFTVS